MLFVCGVDLSKTTNGERKSADRYGNQLPASANAKVDQACRQGKKNPESLLCKRDVSGRFIIGHLLTMDE